MNIAEQAEVTRSKLKTLQRELNSTSKKTFEGRQARKGIQAQINLEKDIWFERILPHLPSKEELAQKAQEAIKELRS